MERFKDFLYNKNDLIIALLILIIAAVVICFRIRAIMNYPSTLTAGVIEQTGQILTNLVS